MHKRKINIFALLVCTILVSLCVLVLFLQNKKSVSLYKRVQSSFDLRSYEIDVNRSKEELTGKTEESNSGRLLSANLKNKLIKADKMTAEEKNMLSSRGVLCNSSRSLDSLRHDPAVLFLRNAIIDTKVIADGGRSVDIPEKFRAESDTTHFIVQFSQPLSGKQKDALISVGAKVEHFVPTRAFAISADKETLNKIREMEGVTYVEPFHPFFKMSREVQAYLTGTADKQMSAKVNGGVFEALLFNDNNAVENIEKLGVKVKMRKGGAGDIAMIHASPDKLSDLVMLESIKWIQPRLQRKVMNDLAYKTIRAKAVRWSYPAFDGSGVTVGIADTGVDDTHRAFAVDPAFTTSYSNNSRIVYYDARTNYNSSSDGLIGDVEGHGSHVAGSIIGNGALSDSVNLSPGSGSPPYSDPKFAGMAPNASLVILEDFNSFDDAEIARTFSSKGVSIASHSWGASNYDYDVSSQEWDAYVRDADSSLAGDQPLITFFAAGNDGGGSTDGSGGTAGTIGSPGNAKNVITIGAVEQLRLCNNLNQTPYDSVANTDSGWQIASYSSRGPTPDGRRKPDVVAPGSYVMSVQSKDVNPSWDTVLWPSELDRDYHYGNLDSGTNYAVMSGTSMATPLAAGAGVLLYQYYTNTYGKVPSPALMKAIMVNSAQWLQSFFYDWSDSVIADGWGMIDLTRAIEGPLTFASAKTVYYDENDTDALWTGGTFAQVYTVSADDEGGLKITIAWTDTPGTPGNGIILENDLDLVVTAPDGTVYHGNDMGRRVWGTASYGRTSYNSVYGDRVNNVETVIIRETVAGDYNIQVKGYQVPSPNQDFVMIISKGVGAGGEPSGRYPGLALDGNGRPVLVYACSETGITGDIDLIGVRHWEGGFGGLSDFNHWRLLKDKWFNYGDTIVSEIINGVVLGSQVKNPSVAVNTVNGNIYTAWVYTSHDTNMPESIYLRYFNGTVWSDLGGSYQGLGICSSNISYSASEPVVGIAGDGQPMVAYIQPFVHLDVSPPKYYQEVCVKKWNGISWKGLDGSDDGIVFPTSLATDMDMTVDTNGRPIVVYTDLKAKRIWCYKWTGGAWSKVGSDLGSAPYAAKPDVAVNSSGNIYVTWLQYPAGVGQYYTTVRLAYSTGGGWSGLDTSMTYPGLSGATNATPENPQVGVNGNKIFVAWQAGSGVGNTILLKQWTGSAWTGIDGSDVPPGIADEYTEKILYSMVVNSYGLPVLVCQNARTGFDEPLVYGLVGDTEPPVFAGLKKAIGTAVNTVELYWDPANAIGSNIVYHIYQSTISWSANGSPVPDVVDVFNNEIAVTGINATNYTVTGLASDTVWYFGVRADNGSALDGNTTLKLAGPYNVNNDGDGDWLPTTNEIVTGSEPFLKDSDSDGMWDGWEWYYSTNNTGIIGTSTPINPHTNSLVLHPMDDGQDNLLTTNLMDGTSGMAPYDDLDGDGLLNIEEFNWWYTNKWNGQAFTSIDPANMTNWWLDPTDPDTDGDGLSDGWELINGMDPGSPGGSFLDPDGDGVVNSNEFIWGTDPKSADTDNDGLSDSNEIFVTFTDPALSDTDADGLMDGFEASVGGNPLNADTDGDGISDGDEYQLGYNNVSNGLNVVMLVPYEDFEDASGTWTNWTTYSQSIDLWHRTTANPDPPSTNNPPPVVPISLNEQSTNYSFRCADDPIKSDTNATYEIPGQMVSCALDSPVFHPFASNVVNMYISWNEYYETEANWDLCEVLVSENGGLSWKMVRAGVSGLSDGWINRTADISTYTNRANIKIRFLFRTKNSVNNAFHGWYVDDIRIYGAKQISGKVRDINGFPLSGAVVFAIGRGGVTNVSQGHTYVLPGKIFGWATTKENGYYEIEDLPEGIYYVKAIYSGYMSEFWDGILYSTNIPYYQAFGTGINPGVTDITRVRTNGLVSFIGSILAKTCNFELEQGSSRGSLDVATSLGGYNVYLNQTATNYTLWNGLTNNPQIVAYNTANSFSSQNYPDWETNNVKPSLISDVVEGNYVVYFDPSSSNMPYISQISVPVRDGEVSRVYVNMNQSTGKIYVTSEETSYPIIIDGRTNTGYQTTGTDLPVIIDVGVGDHEIGLLATGFNPKIAPKQVTVPVAGRAIVAFSTNDTSGALGFVNINTLDLHGNVITGAQVFVNGMSIASNDTITGSIVTPVTLKNLNTGNHWVVVKKDGFRISERRVMTVYENITNTVTFSLHDADEDYDLIGDITEIDGYINIFSWSRNDDPDNDNINNKDEYDLIRLFDVKMNVLDSDSDDDMLLDGEETGYDGITNRFALSKLQDNVVIGDNSIKVYFSGKFLEGINAFNTNLISSTNMWVSLDSDLILVTNLSWIAGSFDIPVMDFRIKPSGSSNEVVSTTHNFGVVVYADTFSDDVDTDDDGMWDKFEHKYQSAGLNPIEYGPDYSDPDNDGLNNIDEFLGVDKIANTNDWTFPDNPDSDGDLMPDGWEMNYLLNPLDSGDALPDYDGDGLVNRDEWQYGTSPTNSDSDSDFLTDGLEALWYGSDPLLWDTDSDGLSDGEEVWDTDNDPQNGLDGGFFPNWNGGDLDNDSLTDGPTDWDTDGDGMPDGFEVKDVWGNIRPVGKSLDPYDSTDATQDPDGDGLSNLDEYLVRDAKVGNHPSVFSNAFNNVIWDYSTDPFNADSDGDGMPDGFEVWYGLHPMDPIKDQNGGFTFVRNDDLWLFGDLDFDGVCNKNEYDVRFVEDPNANTNAILGSTDPWDSDSDDDGLEDGEEVKAFRSDPLNQDSDSDGLVDGTGVSGKKGEVNTALIGTNHYDQALNDLWLLYLPNGYPYPKWKQISTNQVAGFNYPKPRWGAAGVSAAYKVMDDKEGTFVGSPVSGLPGLSVSNQVFLNNDNFVVLGGRDGVKRYYNIWEYSNIKTSWVETISYLDWPYGVSEVATATKIYTIDTYDKVNTPTLRPRPGGPVGFEHYNLSGAPFEIMWRKKPDDDPGFPTLPNWDRTLVFGGWNMYHDYDGGYIHDYVENYTHTYLAYIPKFYKSIDITGTNAVVYNWDSGVDAFEWDFNTDYVDDYTNLYGGQYIPVGATATNVLYSGINIENVLNDAKEVGANSTVKAVLRITYRGDGFSSFPVKIIGELAYIKHSSLQNPSSHYTTTSPDTYYIDGNGSSGYRPKSRDRNINPAWYFNTTAITNVMPAAPVLQVLKIDVSVQVKQMLAKAGWEYGNNMGFIIIGNTNNAGVGYILEDSESLSITIYNQNWAGKDTTYSEGGVWYVPVTPAPVLHPHQRKSTAMAYSSIIDKFVLFGGVDSVRVLDDTWTTYDGFDGWTIHYPLNMPPARWGHCMVDGGSGVIIFGGFDKDNKPLNDIWEFNGTNWSELIPFDFEVPPPRGGAAMCPVGEGGEIAMFGGTDGETYYNDTWMLLPEGSTHSNNLAGGIVSSSAGVSNEFVRWVLIQPNGEGSKGPSPRAFPAYNNQGGKMFVFGGRMGTLPTSSDTDGDWVNDGTERDLGGSSAGRDPRINALIPASLALNTNEVIPYAFKRLGGIPPSSTYSSIYTNIFTNNTLRSAIMDFESLRVYPRTTNFFDIFREMNYAFFEDIPSEGYNDGWSPFHVEKTGYNAYTPGFTNLWWHRYGAGNPDDPLDVWALGEPHSENLPSNAAPPKANSGRWCYGTDLTGDYPDSSVMELYTPLFHLSMPPADSTSTNNTNSFFLVFHEWLDLADVGDIVKIEAVRPSTPADIATRVTGVNPSRPIINILPDRNNSQNTKGTWRRIIVPLDSIANEENLYLRFVLQSDASGHAGGWYIDDVAIMQAGQISGLYNGSETLYLFGANGTNVISSVTSGLNNDFGFDFLAAGNYRIVSGDGSGGSNTTIVGSDSWAVSVSNFDPAEIVLGITINSPAKISWNAIPGMTYEVQYSTPEAIISANPWTILGTVTASGNNGLYIDMGSETNSSRFYRVILKGF